jgi:acetyl-CoA carboxylase carboxyl transferase subunit alpha
VTVERRDVLEQGAPAPHARRAPRGDPPTLSVWQLVDLSRHPNRPYTLDYIHRLVPDFVELRGDRLTGDDPALVGGVGTWHGRTVMIMGQQKGRTLAERVARNWGMMHPEGYRKALRLARQAAKFNFPIVSLVDTPGAFPGAAAEERGIASAIAAAIMGWFDIPVPIVAAVIGEGCSGGALGIAIADRVLMLENATYSVASPEAAASIVWRDNSRKVEAAEQLALTSRDLLAMGVVEEIVDEPEGGAHTDLDRAAAILDESLWRSMKPLLRQADGELLQHRYERFRYIDSLIAADPHFGPKVEPKS